MPARNAESTGYPAMAAATDLVQPAPRRVRGYAAGQLVFDTTRARYVWEWDRYPQYYVPVEDVVAVLVPEGRRPTGPRRGAEAHSLLVAGEARAGAAEVFGAGAAEGLRGTVRFAWSSLDQWFEEDEQVFVHPRNPYVRVDALRSSRAVTVARNGTVLAQSTSTVMVFETGLPTRYYFDPTAVDFSRLEPSDTVTACPYKGRTSAWWHVRSRTGLEPDVAWSYGFPTAPLLPIAGMVAFYNEKVDIVIDGVAHRPPTHRTP